MVDLILTDEIVDAAAPNADAIKNARHLVRKRKFVALFRTTDNSLLFGECLGSCKEPYRVSVDFLNPASPVYRCSCPSRQLPCKHGLGLLYAYLAKSPFQVGEAPSDVAEKRAKQQEKAEKKAAQSDAPAPPKKVNKSALAKRIRTQIEGLDVLEKLLESLVRSGLANLTAKSQSTIREQAKQLTAAFLPGAQRALVELLVITAQGGVGEGARNAMLLDQVTRIHAIVRKGREHLDKRLADPDLALDKESTIDEWLGQAWQIAELRQAGRVETDADLFQLAFNSYENDARDEFVDNGMWLHLGSGRVVQTFTFRPYRVANLLKADDSFFGVVSPKQLCVYPGDLNPRVRWEDATMRDCTPGDFTSARQHAAPTLEPVFKSVKNQLRLPLADKTPLVLVHFERIGRVNGEFVLEDSAGARVALRSNPWSNEPDSTALLEYLPTAALAKQAALLKCFHDLESHRLLAQPLSILTDSAVVRLAY